MLTLGACNVDDPGQVFSCELKAHLGQGRRQATEVTGLSLTKLALDGLAPEVAMAQFRAWAEEVAGE